MPSAKQPSDLHRIIRVYFNRRNAPEGPWSSDHGHGSREENWNKVILAGDLVAETGYDPKAKWPQPSAWLSVHLARVRVHNIGRTLFIEGESGFDD